MFRIGEFSWLVRVSPRMLRHYEKCGLFFPAEIDRFTGYRQYGAGQIPLLTKIVALRDMGFSIDEIGDILPHLDDHAYMNTVLRTKMAAVRSTIEAEQEKLERLMEMSDTVRKERNIMVFEVKLQKLPSVKVLSL
jgi:DNA-binding transcriptional MerR regulator